jgi:hypothetical protein
MPEDGKQPLQGSAGAFRVWPADAKGQLINPPPRPSDQATHHLPNPSDENATEIFFGLLDVPGCPPKEQVELQVEIAKVLRVITRLYLNGPCNRIEAFRCYYVRLFHLARVGLEGSNAAPGVARAALAATIAELVDDEAGNVKNANMKRLGLYALLYSLPFLALYAAICLFPGIGFDTALRKMHIAPLWLANFSLLWVGCFTGVWLSYGIRKAKVGLVDLVTAEDDRLLPQIRLLFAGTLTFAAGLMFALGFIDLKLGTISLTRITELPTLAYLVGMFFGIGELALPESIGNRAHTLTSAVK